MDHGGIPRIREEEQRQGRPTNKKLTGWLEFRLDYSQIKDELCFSCPIYKEHYYSGPGDGPMCMAYESILFFQKEENQICPRVEIMWDNREAANISWMLLSERLNPLVQPYIDAALARKSPNERKRILTRVAGAASSEVVNRHMGIHSEGPAPTSAAHTPKPKSQPVRKSAPKGTKKGLNR